MEKNTKGVKPSEQDNFVVFVRDQKPGKTDFNNLTEVNKCIKQQQRTQRWLVIYSILTTFGLVVLSVVLLYNLTISKCLFGFGSDEITTTTTPPVETQFLKPLNSEEIRVEFIQIVGPKTKNPQTKPQLEEEYEKEFDPFAPKEIYTGSQPGGCSDIPQAGRFSCFPGALSTNRNQTQNACLIKGCCWDSASIDTGVPFCFYPSDFPSYYVISVESIDIGSRFMLSRNTPSKFPSDVKTLVVDIMYESDERLRIKIYDPANDRYEVPIGVPIVQTRASNPDYEVTVSPLGQRFNVNVKRTDNGEVIFDTSNGVPLIFADQFIQISTQLSSRFIYGLGEHRGPFLHSVNRTTFSFWTRDQPPEPNINLYGDHPFFLSLDTQGKAYGVFLLNSNAMEVDILPMPALSYKTIGGILDFYIFTGPKPNDVLRQYTNVIGRTIIPPYWGLGFHLCKFGYGSAAKVKKVIARTRASKIPYDTQWNDIDYARNKLDWTYDHDLYADLPNILQDLHDHGQHYIMIVDPAIGSNQTAGSYPPYDQGIKEGVFVMKQDGSGPIKGTVWPGETVFPDFLNPVTINWWFRQAQSYHSEIPFNGMWIDMNEPSSFVDGSTEGCPGNSSLDNPPWIPNVGGFSLYSRTLCPSSKHALSSHYNLHSLYGFSESLASNLALNKLFGTRSVIITRSTFPSSGLYAGHWLGDNISEWPDLYYSIPGILNFQLFGIPFVGADICGFRGDVKPELCIRWMQLGSFYPFMRNHNNMGQKDQDPGVFDNATQDAMRIAVNARYNMLPYLYTLFYQSNVNGSAVARPLFFEFPGPQTYAIDKQFLWGDGLLISPVLTQGAVTVSAFIPTGYWYDYYTGAQVQGQDSYVTLDAPLDHINLHIRGGSIIPTQPPNVTTTLARKNKFGLLVGQSKSGMAGEASGELYIDDGESLNPVELDKYSLFSFRLRNNVLTSFPTSVNYKRLGGFLLGTCRVMGLDSKPNSVIANYRSVPFHFDQNLNVLYIENLSLDMMAAIRISWT